MSKLYKQNTIITYIFELGLIKSVSETRQFMRLNGDFFLVLMFGALTYYFYLKGTGKLKDEDDPFVK